MNVNVESQATQRSVLSEAALELYQTQTMLKPLNRTQFFFDGFNYELHRLTRRKYVDDDDGVTALPDKTVFKS